MNRLPTQGTGSDLNTTPGPVIRLNTQIILKIIDIIKKAYRG